MYLSTRVFAKVGILLGVLLLSLQGIAQPTNSGVLYYKCTKWLKVGRPLSEKATYKVTGGSYVPGRTVKDISLYPTRLGKLRLTITTRKPSKVIHYDYKVLPTPQPRLRVTDRWVEPISSKNRPRLTDKIVAYIKPDPSFEKEYPREARYTCKRTICKLYRNGRLIKQLIVVGQGIELKKLPIRAKDKIVINVEVERTNTRGVREKVEVSNPNFEYTF